MGDRRKLHAEIDRVLKKVGEGIEEYEKTLEKFDKAHTNSLKEKYETDLKKEIKKLQRLREQIKAWLSNNDAKDKRSQLQESRKWVESVMEKFKVIEKEAKTKAFSREGLVMAAKQQDPHEMKKQDVSEWLNSCITQLKEQVSEFDEELEKLNSVSKKKKNRVDGTRIAELDQLVEWHKLQERKLETLVRLVMNDSVNTDQAEAIKEELQYYIDENQDPDFCMNEFIFEDLPIDEEGNALLSYKNSLVNNDLNDEEPIEEPTVTIFSNNSSPSPSPAVSNAGSGSGSKSPKDKVAKTNNNNSKESVVNNNNNNTHISSAGNSASVIPISANPTTTANLNSSVQAQLPPGLVNEGNKSSSSNNNDLSKINMTTAANAKINPLSIATGKSVAQSPAYIARMVLLDCGFENIAPLDSTGTGNGSGGNQANVDNSNNTPISNNHSNNNGNSKKCPIYCPQTPCTTPLYYPQMPIERFSHPSTFEQMEIETLFFIFYYQPGTYQQYLAARELKRQAWRYHKKLCTWFQRHEDQLRDITDDYEQGVYIYFDYENGWCQRKRKEFAFEYKYLEDVEMP